MKDSNTVIITGYSGAGITSVLKDLEDLGFEVFDNFPLSLVDPLFDENKPDHKIAIGIDARTRGFSSKALLDLVDRVQAKLVFVTCDERELQKRFSETRRRHPLARNSSLITGIEKERAIFKDIQNHSDLTIDTTHLSIHDLRHILERHFGDTHKGKLAITLISFGFKYGSPREADIIMDVGFLKNPHWEKDLKPFTGQDKAVGDYIEQDPDFGEFFENLKALLKPLIPRYRKEGKSYLTIAIGCTGGRHRSVYTVEKLKAWLSQQDLNIHAEHRDIGN